MKISKKISAILIASSLIILISIIGCSSTGMQRSLQTSTTMETMDKDIKIVIGDLDATGASLEALMRPNQQEIKNNYESFK